jgi:hypothetical protein
MLLSQKMILKCSYIVQVENNPRPWLEVVQISNETFYGSFGLSNMQKLTDYFHAKINATCEASRTASEKLFSVSTASHTGQV